MRKLLIFFSTLFLILGIIFTYLPLEQFAIIPLGLSFLFGFLAITKSEIKNRNTPIIILVLTALVTIWALIKIFAVESVVAKDATFEKTKIENKKEDKKELEELENDLE